MTARSPARAKAGSAPPPASTSTRTAPGRWRRGPRRSAGAPSWRSPSAPCALRARRRAELGSQLPAQRPAAQRDRRFGETFNTELRWIRNDVDLPGGSFVTDLGRLRLSYSFTPRIFVQALAQYNDQEEIQATNLRFAWLQAASTGLCVVYDEIRALDGAAGRAPDRSLSVKLSRLFDLPAGGRAAAAE